MKKQTKKLVTLIMAVIMCFSSTAIITTAASNDAEVLSSAIITPRFTAIANCGRALSEENAYGKLNCIGDTSVHTGYGYTSGVIVELQRKSGSSWSTVKTWSNYSGGVYSVVDEYYYVTNGTYQLKVTHEAHSGSILVEDFVAYSDEVVVSY